MRALICGGAKSGKSHYAQELARKLSEGGRRYYVATMIPFDEEDRERIRRHLLDRAGLGFETAECPRQLTTLSDKTDPTAAYLVDSLTALMQNALFPPEKGYAMDLKAADECREDVLSFADKVQNVVFVSDNIFSDALAFSETTERFRKCLGELHCLLAEKCDLVLECTGGLVTVYKGKELL